MRVSVIMPALNEAENLRHLLPRLARVPQVDEVILVDGRSTDGTAEVAQALMPNIVTVRQRGKGRGDAIRQGTAVAEGQYLVILDADGSQRPEEIPLLLAKAREGYAIVKGSRYMDGGGTQDETWDRFVMVRLAQGVANALWRTSYSDIVYGLCLIRRDTFQRLGLRARRNCLEYEMMAKAARQRMTVGWVPAFEEKRRHGKAKFSYLRDGIAIAGTVFAEAFKMWWERLRRRGHL